MTVTYCEVNGIKKFDVAQALSDSGWGVSLEDILKTEGLELMDRKNSNHRATVSSIRFDRFMQMYFVSFAEGGWLCLDHAINQFERAAE